MNDKEFDIVKRIHKGLSFEKFHQWYENDYESYIAGDEDCKSTEEIFEDIKQLFNIDFK